MIKHMCADRCPTCGRMTSAEIRRRYGDRNRKSKRWAKFIATVRKQIGCNKKEFAELINRSEAYVCRFERTGWVPSFKTCEHIAEVLSLNRSDVLAAAGYV